VQGQQQGGGEAGVGRRVQRGRQSTRRLSQAAILGSSKQQQKNVRQQSRQWPLFEKSVSELPVVWLRTSILILLSLIIIPLL